VPVAIVPPSNSGVWRDSKPYFMPSHYKDNIESVLRRRGQEITHRGKLRDTLVPIPPPDEHLPLRGERFRECFGDAAFRKIARRLTFAKGAAVPVADLVRMAGQRTDEFLSVLEECEVVVRADDTVKLIRQADNIGPTLECYVSDVCRRELAGSSEWGVVLEGLPAGGDFDVLAWLGGPLVYIECKSSRPADIDVSELRAFLQRSQELSPELTILLVDTESDLSSLMDRLTDATLPVMRKLSRRPDDWKPDRPWNKPSQAFPSVYYGWPGIHVVNSKPSIITQLRRCLQHYHAKVKGKSWIDGRPTRVNFVTGATDET